VAAAVLTSAMSFKQGGKCAWSWVDFQEAATPQKQRHQAVPAALPGVGSFPQCAPVNDRGLWDLCCTHERAHTVLSTSPQVMDMDVELLDKKIDQMMPELGFRRVWEWGHACFWRWDTGTNESAGLSRLGAQDRHVNFKRGITLLLVRVRHKRAGPSQVLEPACGCTCDDRNHGHGNYLLTPS